MPVTTIRGGRQITDSTIPYADIQNVTANTVLANNTASATSIQEVSLSNNNLLGRGATGNISAITASNGLEFSGTVLQTAANLRSLNGLSYVSPSFVKITGANTFSLDTNTYLTSAVTTISFGSTGLTPSTATSGAVTVAGTLAVSNGGTGATTLTGILIGNGTSAVTALSSSTAFHVLRVNSLGTGYEFAAAAGNVTKVGTPVDNQIAVWTGDGTIEGDTAFTFNTTSDIATIGVVDIGKFPSSAATIFRYAGLADTAYALSQDSSGSTYLNAPTGQLIRFTINNNGAGSAYFTQNGFHLGDIVNTSPARRFHITRESSDNLVNYAMRLTQQTTLTPAAGLGIGIEFEVETASTPNLEVGATIEAAVTDVTATSEDFDLIFKTMAAGATAAERLRIISTGQLKLSAYTSSSSFTGTPVGYLQFDSSGNIITSALPSGGVGGSTGSVDNAVLRADGTGGSTIQSSSLSIDDSANLTLGTSSLAGSSRTITANGSATDVGVTISNKGTGTITLIDSSTNTEIRLDSAAEDIRIRKKSATANDQNAVLHVDKIIDPAPTSVGAFSRINFSVTNNSGVQITPGYISAELTSFSPSNGDLKLYSLSSGSNVSTLNCSSGIVKLPQGQIEFPATQNGSSNANTLDDYEEGSFTPSLSATASTFSYNSRVGSYVKVGRVVHVTFRIQLNTSGNTLVANALTITGLPFQSGSTTNQIFAGDLQWTNLSIAANRYAFRLLETSTTLTLSKLTATTSSSTATNMVATDLNATGGSILFGTLTYIS